MLSEHFLTFTSICWVLAAESALAFAPSRITARPRTLSSPLRRLTPHPTRVPRLRPLGSRSAASARGIELAGLVYDDTARAFEAWEWTAGLGAPAALVAGAVLVTLSDTRREMQPKRADARWIRRSKQAFRFLIMSSFALEVICIFVSTVMGTVLLSHPGVANKIAQVGYGSPIGLLRHHHEIEYLTIQIGFLQGLFNWLLAVAIEFIIPKQSENGRMGETKSARRMNKCMASCLLTLVFWIQAFYNHHLAYYPDYFSMLRRYAVLFWRRYVWCRPVRPMALLYVPGIAISTVLAVRAFTSPPEHDED